MTEAENDIPIAKRREEQVFNEKDTEKIAKTFGKDGLDPAKDKIAPSLLSAEHIDYYVRKTGLIGPYYRYGGKKGRLKKAAYEGRIGNRAYIFRESGDLFGWTVTDNLIVPANSIVFVECDLEFRLPEFIALRFNLQIRHVHRGLLLGTGPLVDPGYWGKLCIPLHNLTDQPYTIPKAEGLIWLEFTKTTSDLEEGAEPMGRPPLDKEFWEIKEFILKAQSPIGGEGHHVPIRSSMDSLIVEAKRQAEDAKEALESATASADEAKISATQMRDFGGLITAGVMIALFALWLTIIITVNSGYSRLEGRIDKITNTEDQLKDVIKGNDEASSSQKNIERQNSSR